MAFERRDPFPYLATFTKSEALNHADLCDQWLGLRVAQIEEKLSGHGSSQPAPDSSGDHQQLWFGLAPRDLQTPYYEIRKLLESLRSMHVAENFQQGEMLHVVDLGAAYARMAFVIERHFSNIRFSGFEYVGERVSEARLALRRFGAARSTIEHVDLTSSSFQIPRADVYFIYDYGTPAAIEKTLHDLRRVTSHRSVTLIARGRVCRYAIESRHSFWLSKADPLASESAVTVYSSLLNSLDDVGRIETAMENGI